MAGREQVLNNYIFMNKLKEFFLIKEVFIKREGL